MVLEMYVCFLVRDSKAQYLCSKRQTLPWYSCLGAFVGCSTRASFLRLFCTGLVWSIILSGLGDVNM